ncbi:nucleotide-diphospho-sugar transferase [Immersiella caudata]|uniref:Nucleotide-diphospho-sugar transferase n=1 Tax=Immersiella caudata TaxID=314043 RepID=A0AA39WIT0_9PEZI|nr:nucleotide-diphospho-sugar transferase [Immersiella caudata]
MLAPLHGRSRARTCVFATVSFVLLIVLSSLPLLRATAPRVVFNTDQPPDSEIPIPKSIWQIFFPPPGAAVLDHDLVHSNDWIEMAPGYTYTLVSASEADRFIAENFGHRPEIGETYHALTNPAQKSDFLRYLLLYIRGGLYADVDTKPLVRLDDWIPPERRRDVKLLIAVEYDETVEAHPDDFTYPVQFCQWTIAAAPRHPVFAKMIDRVLTGLNDVARVQGTTLDKVNISDYNVLNTTGPVAWTEVVFSLLQETSPNPSESSIKTFADVMGIKEDRYHGDVVIMPSETFRGDYLDDWGISLRQRRKSLVRHFFKGAWKNTPT